MLRLLILLLYSIEKIAYRLHMNCIIFHIYLRYIGLKGVEHLENEILGFEIELIFRASTKNILEHDGK